MRLQALAPILLSALLTSVPCKLDTLGAAENELRGTATFVVPSSQSIN